MIFNYLNETIEYQKDKIKSSMAANYLYQTIKQQKDKMKSSMVANSDSLQREFSAKVRESERAVS